MEFSDTRLEEAYRFAKRAHGDQKDRYGKDVFQSHVLQVFKEAGGADAPTDIGVIALLHDVLEKTPVDRSEITDTFGDKISQAVVDLSRAPETPYFEYIEDLASNPLAVTVKRADLKANLAQAKQLQLPDDKKRVKKYARALLSLEPATGYEE